jgi:hypothetical protein
MVVDKWRSYLVSHPFVIKSDHKSICHLQDQSMPTEMQRKAMVKLAGPQFTLQYKKGPENKVVDALSRVGHNFLTQSTSAVIPIWIQEVINSYVEDPDAQKLLQELSLVSPNSEGYTLSQGLIRFKKKVWVGANSALQTKIIFAFHASPIGGHSRVQATLQRISKLFWWKGLR